MKKKLIFIMFCLIFTLGGCSLFSSTKDYTVDDLTITISGNYAQRDQVGMKLCLVSNKTVIGISKNNAFSEYSLEGFTNIIKQNMGIYLEFESDITESGADFLRVSYNNTASDDVEYSYISGIFKYSNEFYIVDIACKASNKTDSMIESYINILKTVKLGSESN